MRVGTDSDAAAFLALRAEWHGGPVSSAGFAESFTSWFRRELPTRWWWLAHDDEGVPLGMVNLKIFERMPSPTRGASRWGYLSNLYVVSSHRGAGIGGGLIEALLERAMKEGLVRVVLSPSTASVPLYGRYGFSAAGGLLVRQLDGG
ncbi:MAG TPA: GNAT family N-acetyltransferase [Mycobacteriales bacterium]|nr:GNAT family N-acetyltransferase [Mycobacteriales bacterium]